MSPLRRPDHSVIRTAIRIVRPESALRTRLPVLSEIDTVRQWSPAVDAR